MGEAIPDVGWRQVVLQIEIKNSLAYLSASFVFIVYVNFVALSGAISTVHGLSHIPELLDHTAQHLLKVVFFDPFHFEGQSLGAGVIA